MSTDEIKSYFLGHRDQKICGHFISSQINRKISNTEQVLTTLHEKAGKIKYRIPRIAASFLIVSMMTLSGCNMGPSAGEAEYITTGDSIYVTPEMQRHSDSLESHSEKIADSLNKQKNH